MESEVESMTRTRLSITLPQNLVEWIDQQVEDRKFFSRSHAIEVLILKEMEK